MTGKLHFSTEAAERRGVFRHLHDFASATCVQVAWVRLRQDRHGRSQKKQPLKILEISGANGYKPIQTSINQWSWSGFPLLSPQVLRGKT